MPQRDPVHDTTVHFRANATLVALAQEAARRDCRTLSEVLRNSLRAVAKGEKVEG